MSVFFKEISTDNPIRQGDVERILEPLGVTVKEAESRDYQTLLAAVHDCAQHVLELPDYQPSPDLRRYPRLDLNRPSEKEQAFGHAWAHRFLIKGSQLTTSELRGKSVCIKDCIAVAGIPQFFGSDAFPAWTPSTDATVVTRMLDAGADIVGTATCEHFCNSTSSFTSAQGTVENPHRAGYSAGGSTSGGAALVAGGIVDIALGTDQGGSIRVPASLCGIVGLKPTHGLIPYTGITSGDQIDDHAGPLARSVSEVAASLDAMAGYDDTKEKPFVCHCGAAFARKDLLVRHRRISLHEGNSPTETSPTTQAAEADLAAAVSLSGLSTDPWANQQIQPGTLPLQLDGRDGRNVDNRTQYPHELLSPRLFGAGEPPGPEDMSCQVLGDSIQFDPHFREFANFLDGVGLPAEWSPYFNGPEKENENEVVDSELRQFVSESPSPRPRQRAGTPFSSWLPSAPTGNRITNYASENNPRAVDPETQRFKITDEQRAGLKACLDSFSDVLDPTFRMPSRHALTRYITSWFEGFHSHMPFIHCRTWNVLDHSLELILGIASIGAQYCFEHSCSERLFFAGKAILMERLRKSPDSLGPRTSSYLNLNTPALHRRPGTDISPTDPTETVRALIALMGYATWEPKASMVREAFALQGLLAQVLRDIGLEEDDEIDHTPPPASAHRNAAHNNWLAWVGQESRRRSKLIAFSFLHTHSIAYNVYPVLLSNEVKLRLPCSTREWKAGSAAQWQAATKDIKKQQLYFQDALSLLLRNQNGAVPLDPIPTPLGNYLLLHGLLQRIHIVRELSLPVSSDIAALPAEEVDKLERGLRSWTTGWQQAAESSLDPNNENGPIPFTSSSLLALAYVRIHLNLGPYRHLETRDTSRIAKALSRSPCVERSDGVIAALLYAVHMLSIPVRLGIDRVARSQAFFWSVRHTLSSLDCSILLSKWLGKLGETMASAPLTDSEDRILHWVRSIVEEANDVVDFEDEEKPLGDLREPRQLGLAVLKIWAHFFKRNTQWPFINIIGTGLEKYREILIRNSS